MPRYIVFLYIINDSFNCNLIVVLLSKRWIKSGKSTTEGRGSKHTHCHWISYQLEPNIKATLDIFTNYTEN